MGKLYIVSTPIGSLKDITFRAIEILRSVDLVVCEDTRVFGKLALEYQIDKPLLAVNDFNEEAKIGKVILELQDKDIALVSDAGTPLVSDPGYKLVREAIAKGFAVEAIPGPTAAITALAVSGLPTDKFLFVGYLSKKDGKRKEMLEQIKKSRELVKSTIIFYESPYRVIKTLESIMAVFGDIDAVVCRELTKMHEEIRREKISDLIVHFSKIAPKGEFVILI